MEKGVLIDLTRCIGCRGCQIACKEWNERKATHTVMDGDYTNPKALSSNCYTRIRFHEQEKSGAPVWSFVKNQCLHCKEPACASACPVGALKKTPDGPVTYTFDRCFGCRYCMVACPFEIPKYEWESVVPWVQKCSFCSERIKAGEKPACVKVCPTGTMFYGGRDEVLDEARKRISGAPGKYVNHIYGEKEAGGTSWLYISDVPFGEIGFNMAVSNVALPSITWPGLSKIPLTAAGIVAALSAVAYFRNRGNGGA